MKNKIISILKSSDGYISGEQISRTLGITRSAVWKYIKKLRDDGFTIDSVTNKGYKISYSPDIITAQLILDSINTEFIARNIIYYDEVTSTNTVAKQNCSEPDGTLFVADTQTAGRGRMGRSWSAPKSSGIWMSLLLKPQIALEDTPKITLISGISVCTALNRLYNLGAKIKWPNDIVVNSKKICGILTELSADTDGLSYVIPGIGINVLTPSFPPELESKATSVYIETNRHTERYKIICAVMEDFEKNYKVFLEKGFAALLPLYRSLCINIGREVVIIKEGTSKRARCTGVTESGNLIVEADGERIDVNSGEVSVRGIYGYV